MFSPSETTDGPHMQGGAVALDRSIGESGRDQPGRAALAPRAVESSGISF